LWRLPSLNASVTGNYELRSIQISHSTCLSPMIH
jgi:hypothetical protein